MCTRIYNNFNPENKFLTTARNMDWAEQMPTTIFVFKTNLDKPTEKIGLSEKDTDALHDNPLTWIARYDSVVNMVGVNAPYGASDGINSAGLVANLLYDSDASYHRNDSAKCKQLDVLRWVQFVLDTCASVKEVVNQFNENATVQIEIIGAKVPGSTKEASLHLAVSDKFGDSAIIEVHKGTFVIYHNMDFRIMTNEPSYAKQIELNQYWRWQWSSQNHFPSSTLPGGPFPSDRFARASYYLNHLHPTHSSADSLAQSKSIVMNASVPVNFNSEDDNFPNIAQTLWTSVSDHNNLLYFFCNARTMGDLYIDLNELDRLTHPVSQLVVVDLKEGKFINKEFYGACYDKFEKADDPFAVQAMTLA